MFFRQWGSRKIQTVYEIIDFGFKGHQQRSDLRPPRSAGMTGWHQSTCAQGRCATRLRYSPTFAASLILNHILNFRYRLACPNRPKTSSTVTHDGRCERNGLRGCSRKPHFVNREGRDHRGLALPATSASGVRKNTTDPRVRLDSFRHRRFTVSTVEAPSSWRTATVEA